MTRTCPDCRYPMVSERHHDVELDLCRNCAGIWFDADELRRLIASDPIGLLALEDHLLPRVKQQRMQSGAFICPNCNSLLHVYHYQYNSPIELNACDDCGGFWVQEGELTKIQQWRSQHAIADEREAQSLALARAAMEHEHALSHLEGVRWFCGLLRQQTPLWWGSNR